MHFVKKNCRRFWLEIGCALWKKFWFCSLHQSAFDIFDNRSRPLKKWTNQKPPFNSVKKNQSEWTIEMHWRTYLIFVTKFTKKTIWRNFRFHDKCGEIWQLEMTNMGVLLALWIFRSFQDFLDLSGFFGLFRTFSGFLDFSGFFRIFRIFKDF